MLRLREPVRLNHQRRRTHAGQIHRYRFRLHRGRFNLSGLGGGCSGGRSLLSPSRGFSGFGFSGSRLGLRCFQSRLELGDDLGVYGSLGCGHGLIEGRLGLSGGGRSLLSPSRGRVGLSLGRGGVGFSGGRLGFCRGRGSLSRGGIGVRNAVVAVVAACGGQQPEGSQDREPTKHLRVFHLSPPGARPGKDRAVVYTDGVMSTRPALAIANASLRASTNRWQTTASLRCHSRSCSLRSRAARATASPVWAGPARLSLGLWDRHF